MRSPHGCLVAKLIKNLKSTISKYLPFIPFQRKILIQILEFLKPANFLKKKINSATTQ